MKYFENSETIIDVTKAPYNCDNTGNVDCTEALCRALNDILKPNIEGINNALEKLNSSDDPNYAISFEIRKRDGVPNVIFPEDLCPARILYFPKGTYLVSDTISHKLENLKNILLGEPTMEINRQIYIKGESRDETVIKLKDNSAGFGFGDKKPIISYIMTEKSNIAMTNTIADITIDCGSGNSGAVGLKFNSSNSGAIRNVKIKSSDIGGRGYCGLLFDTQTECYIKNLSVYGFDYGIRVEGCDLPVVGEDIHIYNQKVCGIMSVGSNVSLLNFTSRNGICAFKSEGANSQSAIINGDLTGGNGVATGIVITSGEAYMRNVKTDGYRWPYWIGWICIYFDPYIKEEATSEKIYTLFKNTGLSLNMDIEYAPDEYEPSDSSDIAFVKDFGATGDGKTDATEAIQKAMNSGKPYICFGSGHYLVSGTVTVPETVKTVDFMYCDFYSAESLKNAQNTALFKIEGEAKEHITLKNVFTWEKFYGYFRFIEQATKRTLVLRDLHTQCAGMYFNSTEGGKVFIENCACTMGGEDYCTVSPFEFKGQKVWCRNINPERGDVQILNDNSDLWIFGMKTETHVGRFASTAVKNINGGRVEGFGIRSGIGGKGIPLYINDNSDMTLYFACGSFSERSSWDILVRETQGCVTKDLMDKDAQKIDRYSYRVPGYVGVRK